MAEGPSDPEKMPRDDSYAADPTVLAQQVKLHSQFVRESGPTIARLELKLNALGQLLRDKGVITSDEYKRLTLWGTDSTR